MAIQTYQLVISGNCAGQFVQNVLHFFFDDAGFSNPVSAAKGLVDGFLAAAYEERFLDMCPANYLMMSIKARRRTGGIGPEWIDLSVTSFPGNRAGNSQSSSNGPVILWLPISPNRVTCKTFIPGISIADSDQGEINAAALTAIRAAAVLMLEPFPVVGGGGVPASICCVKSGDPAERRLISAVEVCKEIGVQRRRQLPV